MFYWLLALGDQVERGPHSLRVLTPLSLSSPDHSSNLKTCLISSCPFVVSTWIGLNIPQNSSCLLTTTITTDCYNRNKTKVSLYSPNVIHLLNKYFLSIHPVPDSGLTSGGSVMVVSRTGVIPPIMGLYG